MAKCSASTNSSKLGAVLDKLHKINGGSKDNDEKEFAVIPTFLPPLPRVVITVTPVANCPNKLRISRGLSLLIFNQKIEGSLNAEIHTEAGFVPIAPVLLGHTASAKEQRQ